MAGLSDLERFRDIARTILNTPDAQTIENRKIAAIRRLSVLSEQSQPIEFAESQFELACCYLLRHDGRVKGRQLRHAEDHYTLALRALNAPIYCITRAIIQATLAEGYDRLRSKKGLNETARDRMNTLLRAAAASFLEGDEPVEAAIVYMRLAELHLDENDCASASEFGDQSLSLVLRKTDGIELKQMHEIDQEKITDLLDRQFHLQKGIAEYTNRKLLRDQENFSVAAARQAVANIAPQFNQIPSYLVDELFEALDEESGLHPRSFYSLGDLVEFKRRRGTMSAASAFPRPRDVDLRALDSMSGVSGRELMHLANEYRSARTSPMGYAIVPVYYATDRVPTGHASPENYFGDGRDPAFSPLLSFGLSHVSIPRDHRTGSLEAPKLWRFEFRPRPEKHVMVLSIGPLKPNPFFRSLDSDLAARADGAALLFIHGYNVTFSDALRRTAQLCYDLNWPGIPITYSWPSWAKTRLYPADEATIDATVPLLSDFLERLTRSAELRVLHVVCHSMGARALTRALATLIENTRSERPLINEVVLAAPDIDSQVFAQLAEAIRSKCDRITLYASSKDLALVASRTLHAFPRAGESGQNMVVLPDLLDTIDATTVDTNLLGHSYFGDERSIIADLFGVVNRREPPAIRFGLQQVMSPKGRYWAFQP